MIQMSLKFVPEVSIYDDSIYDKSPMDQKWLNDAQATHHLNQWWLIYAVHAFQTRVLRGIWKILMYVIRRRYMGAYIITHFTIKEESK